MSDEALMATYATGRVTAFECLYLRHKEKLFAFLRRQCENSAVAEELVHDTWMAVIGRAGSYQPTANFTTWLFSIAHYRLVDFWRKRGGTSHVLLEDVAEVLANDKEDVLQALELRDLCKNLEILSASQLEAVLLRVEGFSYAEIAQITEAKQETVKSRLRYATRHLRSALEASL